MGRLRRDDGAGGIEYVALLLLVGAVILALLVAGIAPASTRAVRRALCQMFRWSNCEDVAGPGGPGSPEESEPLNRLGLPCLAGRQTLDVDANVLVKGVQGAGSVGYVIDQIGANRWRVTFYEELSGGVGAKGGAEVGSLDPNWRLKAGRYGKAWLTAGGRAAISYDFATREEAEAFANNPVQWLRAIDAPGAVLKDVLGAPGRLIPNGLGTAAANVFGSTSVPVSFTHATINLRGVAEGGYNSGPRPGAGLGANGELSGVRTKIHLPGVPNEWTIFSASADGELGAQLHWRFGAVAGSRGGALRYRVIWDKNDEPLRLTLVSETKEHRRGGGMGGREGRSGVGAGGAGVYTDAHVTVTEMNLDLRDPANRAAFEAAFVNVPGLIAYPRGWGSAGGTDLVAMAGLVDRFVRDGVTVRVEYDERRPTGVVGGGAGVVAGAEASLTAPRRTLTSATISDAQWSDTTPREWTTCWSDEEGHGPPVGGGDIGGS